MPSPDWVIERLSKSHDTRGFDCGNEASNEFLMDSARACDRAGFARTYVAIRSGKKAVSGYYTVRNGTVEFRDPPADVEKRLPRYPVPVVRLAELAVTGDAKGSGLGTRLLVSALQLSLAISTVVDVQAVAALAEDDEARGFYEKFGFKALPESGHRLYLTLKTLRKVKI
jgi:GNAT superfamily N-acetyltransferase